MLRSSRLLLIAVTALFSSSRQVDEAHRSQAAAQACEHARRIRAPENRGAGRTVFDLNVSDVQAIDDSDPA
jgi:hypothetical protein